MTEYQEKQWNIFICNVSFSLFNFTQASSPSLPLILHSLHIVWRKSEHCSSYSCFFEIIRCSQVVITRFWPLAVLISAITSQMPGKVDVTVTLKPAIKKVVSGEIKFELSWVMQEDDKVIQ